ncbi:hypothetical protein ACIPSA_22150 [Streptomyces sp. NPDC086549]|uniref:hypothetical protein n=1 Tax=Streptomyces sp. NPDC086549 TaxID=3365752 RepID=UPI00381AE3B2
MPWTRGLLAALAVCVLLPAGTASCGSGEARERGGDRVSASPVGELLDRTDERGRRYRQVGRSHAPGVGVEVTPDAGGSWDVRLTVRDFRFSPAGVKAEPVAGRGLAYLFVDGDLVTRLRRPGYRLAARLVPHGTHHVTARLYADDGTVWAVHGRPVESTADITASGAETASTATPAPAPAESDATSSSTAVGTPAL